MALFETERLLYRLLQKDDMPKLHTILSDPEVMKYSVRGVCDEPATTDFIEWSQKCYELHAMGPLALVDRQSRELIGFCGVSPEEVHGVEEFDLGYRLSRRYWGNGLATEAAQAVMKYAFGLKNIESILAVIEPNNIASIRVAEKVGFMDFRYASFHGRRVNIYRMSRDKWSEIANGNG